MAIELGLTAAAAHHAVKVKKLPESLRPTRNVQAPLLRKGAYEAYTINNHAETIVICI